jgi:hypothetical protein
MLTADRLGRGFGVGGAPGFDQLAPLLKHVVSRIVHLPASEFPQDCV